MQHDVSVEASSLLLHSINRNLFVNRDDSLTLKIIIMRTEHANKCFVPHQKLRVRLDS